MRTTLLFLFGLIWFAMPAMAQKFIELDNPSFEDTPVVSQVPVGWVDCGFPGESPPDVQPGGFHVIKQADDGETYLGMVVRDNGTYEAVSQELNEPLLPGKLYELRLVLARAPTFISLSRTTMEEVNYEEAVILRVWGGSDDCCEEGEILWETAEITHTAWREYFMDFAPEKGPYRYIKLEAFYKPDYSTYYNGNLLLDNCSLVRID